MNRDVRAIRMGWSAPLLAILLAPGLAAEGGRSSSVEDAYLEHLASWARGSVTALTELSDLQQRVVSHAAGFEIDRETFFRLPNMPVTADTTLHKRLPGIGCLRQIQQHAEAQLGELDPEALLPLAYFDHLLYAQQMEAEFRPWLAEHSRERAFRLTASYRRAGEPREEAKRNVVSMLIAMADRLGFASFQETGEESREVFSQVLELDSGNRVALYWLAYLEERRGHYGKAVRYLDRLISAGVDDAEIALRLAINRDRAGLVGRPDRRLEQVARGDGPEWTRRVAYQQLGRANAERQGDRAVTYLREAIEQFPGDARLRLQLSYLLNADWRESSALARAVETGWAGDSGESARLRYCKPRRDEIEVELEHLRGEVRRRLPSLAQSLEQMLERPYKLRLRSAECPVGLEL